MTTIQEKRQRAAALAWAAFIVLLDVSNTYSADLTPAQTQFFEAKVRPVLIDNCYKCHIQQAEKIKGSLLLDTREGLLKGGDSGPAVVPGDPEKSLLIKAVTYKDLQLKMPPTGKLSEEEIQRLSAWVKMGVPDPRKEVASVTRPTAGIDFEKARTFWAFRKIQNPAVPAV